jgi:hypothetical protein
VRGQRATRACGQLHGPLSRWMDRRWCCKGASVKKRPSLVLDKHSLSVGHTRSLDQRHLESLEISTIYCLLNPSPPYTVASDFRLLTLAHHGNHVRQHHAAHYMRPSGPSKFIHCRQGTSTTITLSKLVTNSLAEPS